MWDGSGNTTEKLKEWAQKNDPERDLQLERFMLQYDSVKTFLWSKRQALRENFAEKMLQANKP
jgi:hypothetical protein